MSKKNINKNLNWIKKTLIKINPEIQMILKKENLDLVNNGYIDSLMIIRLLFEIEKKFKKRLNPSKIKREYFSSVESISKFLTKIK